MWRKFLFRGVYFSKLNAKFGCKYNKNISFVKKISHKSAKIIANL